MKRKRYTLILPHPGRLGSRGTVSPAQHSCLAFLPKNRCWRLAESRADNYADAKSTHSQKLPYVVREIPNQVCRVGHAYGAETDNPACVLVAAPAFPA